jgi:hypothetical protein
MYGRVEPLHPTEHFTGRFLGVVAPEIRICGNFICLPEAYGELTENPTSRELSPCSKQRPDATERVEKERPLNQQKQDGGEAERGQDGHRQA